MVYLAKMNNLLNHHGAGSQRRGTQCSCIGCIGLRPALLAIFTDSVVSGCVEVDCQRQQTYCLRLHFLHFAIANLFMILVASILHRCSCSILLKSGCSACFVEWCFFVHSTIVSSGNNCCPQQLIAMSVK